MKEINSEIEIAVSGKKVWNKIIDFNAWHSWNPIIHKLTGELKINTQLHFIMSNSKGGSGKKYIAYISSITPNSFTYTATMMSKFLFLAERIIEIEEINEIKVKFKQKEKYSGIFVGLFWKKLKEDALPMIELMNKSLKKELEK